MQTLEVSVAVLWDAVNRSKVNLVEWWKTHIKTLKEEKKEKNSKKKDSNEELSPWQVQAIDTVSWEKWDISVLSYAIRNCEDLPDKDHKDLRECAKKLNHVRSNCLCHECRTQIAFDNYVRILHTSMECYKTLITEKKAYMEYVEQLKNISKCKILFNTCCSFCMVSTSERLHSTMYMTLYCTIVQIER